MDVGYEEEKMFTNIKYKKKHGGYKSLMNNINQEITYV